jgi:hypothetical protein
MFSAELRIGGEQFKGYSFLKKEKLAGAASSCWRMNRAENISSHKPRIPA